MFFPAYHRHTVIWSNSDTVALFYYEPDVLSNPKFRTTALKLPLCPLSRPLCPFFNSNYLISNSERPIGNWKRSILNCKHLVSSR